MGIYRRELLYRIEYATTVTEEEWRIVAPRENVTPRIGRGDGVEFTVYE
jgi:hypothetical protein